MPDASETKPWPVGVLALVFTDVERSTELWQIDEEAFGWALAEHDQEVRDCLATHHGIEVKHTGDGFFVVFEDVGNAANFCVELQTRLARHPWPSELGEVRTRIGVHLGRARLHGSDYRGTAVNLASRVCAAASGGQTLVSGEAAAALWRVPGLSNRVQRVGSYQLPGLSEAVEIYELLCEATSEFVFRPLSPEPASVEETTQTFDEADDERWQRIKIALRQADNATAIAELVRLHQRHPEDVKVLTTLGVAYAVEAQYDEAETCLRHAVELDQGHAAAWFNLARVYGKMGRREGIEEALQMALKADPGHPKARAVAAKYHIDLPGA